MDAELGSDESGSAELKADLGLAAFEAAWERGEALDLEASTEGVLQEIETYNQ